MTREKETENEKKKRKEKKEERGLYCLCWEQTPTVLRAAAGTRVTFRWAVEDSEGPIIPESEVRCQSVDICAHCSLHTAQL